MTATTAVSLGRYKNRRSKKGSSEISQFIPALYILFLIVFLPLFNLGFLFVSAATLYLATNDFVTKASTQADYPTSLNAMATEAYRFQNMGLAQLLSMFPQGGYTGCGDDLYVVATNIASGAVTTSSADMPLTQPIDTSANAYELSVKSSYLISPVINLSGVPLLGSVPGLGQPVNLTFTAHRPVEHPGGLAAAPSGTSGTTNPVAYFPRRMNNGATQAIASNGTWRDPNIYQQILNNGQTVVSTNILIVKANATDWTLTGIPVLAGQHVYLDTQAVGLWGWGFATDANGLAANGSQYGDGTNTITHPYAPATNIVINGRYNWSVSELIGNVGTNYFALGNTSINLPVTSSGQLQMAINWLPEAKSYSSGFSGEQIVRVIITQ